MLAMSGTIHPVMAWSVPCDSASDVDAATSLKRLLAVMEQQGEVAEMAMLRLESLETTRWLVATQRCGGRGVTQPRAAGAGGDMHVHEAEKLRREALATLQQLHGGVDDSDVAAAMDSLARAVFSSPTADVAEVCVLIGASRCRWCHDCTALMQRTVR